VPGNFHISGHHFPEVVQNLYLMGHRLDFTHKVNHISLGKVDDRKFIIDNFGAKFEFELDGMDTPQKKHISESEGDFITPDALDTNYFLEISQTDYVDKREIKKDNNYQKYEAFRFRAVKHVKVEQGMPGIYFRYDLSPIRILYTISMQSTSDYLVKICAVIGGIYVVSSILDSLLKQGIELLGFRPTESPGKKRGKGFSDK